MKYFAALTCLLLTSVAAPAVALPTNDCAARSEKVKPTERDDFLKSCLAQVGAPANVKEVKQKHKSALCEQNAKNKQLQGNDKASYQSNCMNKNEAAMAASAQPDNVITPSHKQASSEKPKGAPRKAEKKQVAKKQKEHKKGSKKGEQQSASNSGLFGNP